MNTAAESPQSQQQPLPQWPTIMSLHTAAGYMDRFHDNRVADGQMHGASRSQT
jgi:hypothetical protein